MEEAARWLWFEFGLAADPSGAAAIAALATGRVRPAQGQTVSVPVCGAGLPTEVGRRLAAEAAGPPLKDQERIAVPLPTPSGEGSLGLANAQAVYDIAAKIISIL
jgi:threonine dehydratase